MVDALRGVFRVQRIPMCGFVGMDRGVRRDDAFNEGETVRFGLRDGRDRASAALASDDDDAALPSLVLGKAAVDPVHLLICRADVAAEVCAVDFDCAGKGCALDFGGDCFAELVSENEGRLVLAIEIAGELEHGHALDRVRKDDDRGKEVNEGHLAAGKDGPARYAELVRASLALELAARRDRVGV